MNKINYIQGNLFASEREIIAHGCNTKGGFGSGVAGQMARLYPLVKKAYLNKFYKEGWKLGEIQIVPVENKLVVNMATQDSYGKSGVHVDYDACFECFKKLFCYAENHHKNIAIPKIGSGLGGGQWDKIEEKLLEVLKHHNIEVDVYFQ